MALPRCHLSSVILWADTSPFNEKSEEEEGALRLRIGLTALRSALAGFRSAALKAKAEEKKARHLREKKGKLTGELCWSYTALSPFSSGGVFESHCKKQ
jgi:hypothetical protein